MSQMSMLMSLQQATLDSDTSVRRRKGGEADRKFDCQNSPGTDSESDN